MHQPGVPHLSSVIREISWSKAFRFLSRSAADNLVDSFNVFTATIDLGVSLFFFMFFFIFDTRGFFFRRQKASFELRQIPLDLPKSKGTKQFNFKTLTQNKLYTFKTKKKAPT